MCNPVNTGDLYSTLNFSTRATIGLGTPWLFGGLSFLKNTLSMKDQKKNWLIKLGVETYVGRRFSDIPITMVID